MVLVWVDVPRAVLAVPNIPPIQIVVTCLSVMLGLPVGKGKTGRFPAPPPHADRSEGVFPEHVRISVGVLREKTVLPLLQMH